MALYLYFEFQYALRTLSLLVLPAPAISQQLAGDWQGMLQIGPVQFQPCDGGGLSVRADRFIEQREFLEGGLVIFQHPARDRPDIPLPPRI